MKHVLRALIFIFAYGVSLYAARYFSFEVTGLLQDKGKLLESTLYRLGFYTHILLGPLALMAGAWQFLPVFRRNRPEIHRKIGFLYVIAVTLSGLAALFISPFASTGLIASFGFGSLAIAWLYTTFQAVDAIKKREIIRHQHWMYRSYALTFAAVTLRIWLPLFTASGISFGTAYPIIAWLCWIPNLFVAEWIIRHHGLKRLIA